MTKYIVRRVLIAIFIVFIVATMTFFIMKAVPGSPFTEEKTNVVAEEANRVKYGLDKPVYVQYGMYLEKIVKFDFGETLKMQKGTPVLELIKTTFPISAGLGGMAILFAIILGVPLGCIGALKRGNLSPLPGSTLPGTWSYPARQHRWNAGTSDCLSLFVLLLSS